MRTEDRNIYLTGTASGIDWEQVRLLAVCLGDEAERIDDWVRDAVEDVRRRPRVTLDPNVVTAAKTSAALQVARDALLSAAIAYAVRMEDSAADEATEKNWTAGAAPDNAPATK